MSVIFNVAEREPFDFGLKLTLIGQLDPWPSGLTQLLFSRKSAASEPVIVTDEIVSDPSPGLLSVTVFAEVVLPTGSEPKLRLDEFTLAFGAMMVARICTCCGLPVAVSVRLSVAEAAPVLLGHRLSVTLQVLPGAIEVIQPPS